MAKPILDGRLWTIIACSAAASNSFSRPQADLQSSYSVGHFVCPQGRSAVGTSATETGLGLGNERLAADLGSATAGRVVEAACRAAVPFVGSRMN